MDIKASAHAKTHTHQQNMPLCPKSHQMSSPQWKSQLWSQWWWLLLGKQIKSTVEEMNTFLCSHHVNWIFFFVQMSDEDLISLPISGRVLCVFFNSTHNTVPVPHVTHIKSLERKPAKKICHHLHPVPYYHHYWYGTFSEQLVIEFGGLMASSALSMDAVQNHYSDFLEMNHLWTWPRDKKKKKNGFKAFKEIPPSLSLPLLVSFQRNRAGLDLRAASFVVWWWYNAAEPTEFHRVTLTQMFFVLLNPAWACWVISSPSTPGHWPALKQIESLRLDVTEMAHHCRHGQRWIHTG